MSQLVTKLNDDKGRDSIDWPVPIGTWKQGEGINRLETFANNLDVSQVPRGTDLLNSVPTPWARLLLFESALFKTQHPSHRDVEDQWRGLLGVIALANPLNLDLSTMVISLGAYENSDVAKSFRDLRPRYFVGDRDEEDGKWDAFQMILVDGVPLGSTSPRTLVFTGVAHKCPPSIPFQSAAGRLSDPVAYYKRFDDSYYLGLLAGWIKGLIKDCHEDHALARLLGNAPSANGATVQSRMASLVERLTVWLAEMSSVQPRDIEGRSSRFTLAPYTAVKGLPPVEGEKKSDLFLKESRNLIVCYGNQSRNAPAGSMLVNEYGEPLFNEQLHIYDGRWTTSNEPLPFPFNFLPEDIKVIEDPVAFFEDTLIQVNLPEKTDDVYYLRVGDATNKRDYLFPFRSEILSYFTNAEIKANTTITPQPDSSALRVELIIPINNNRRILAWRDYSLERDLLVHTPKTPLHTAELSMWPDFVCDDWTRYYYFKKSLDKPHLDVTPIVPYTQRRKGQYTWYSSKVPATAFEGQAHGKTGLLLLKEKRIERPDKYWKVSVDFGSTHTLAFCLAVEKEGSRFVAKSGERVQPIQFGTHAKHITFSAGVEQRDRFLAIEGTIDPPERNELKTLLMMPEPNAAGSDDWLPREGFVYMHWLYEGNYDADRLRHDLKWNSDTENHDLQAFLRCLLVMIQAEACKKGARVVSIAHSYPSVFTLGLRAKHKAEWEGLKRFINEDLKDRIEIQEPVTETVAVCRHLESQHGEEAPTATNTISIDVGGSTSDMAVWATSRLLIQESLKMAAGIVGQYIQSRDAQDFLNWLERTLRGEPYRLQTLSLASFAGKPAGFGLMFNNLLSVIEWKGHKDNLIEQMNGSDACLKLMAHIVYLYSSLLYYAGLLARKAKLFELDPIYNIYFCGKGGTLISWFGHYEILAQQMFQAGLVGSGTVPETPPTVQAKISSKPKEEVGRGLLAEIELEGDPKARRIGLIGSPDPTVTAGETGYQGVSWDTDLVAATLRTLPENQVPSFDELNELNNFIRALTNGKGTQKAAVELGLTNINGQLYQQALRQRLFGNGKQSIISQIKKGDRDALLEPLFITEAKVLLEVVTHNSELFG